MPIHTPRTGARPARELATARRAEGYDTRRTAQYCGKTGDASDVIGLPGIHIEAKHCEQMRLYEWVEQAIRDAAAGGKNDLPAVFHRKNNAAILVTMTLPDWMALYREWEAGRALERGPQP